jgi:hypothetical protein
MKTTEEIQSEIDAINIRMKELYPRFTDGGLLMIIVNGSLIDPLPVVPVSHAHPIIFRDIPIAYRYTHAKEYYELSAKEDRLKMKLNQLKLAATRCPLEKSKRKQLKMLYLNTRH